MFDKEEKLAWIEERYGPFVSSYIRSIEGGSVSRSDFYSILRQRRAITAYWLSKGVTSRKAKREAYFLTTKKNMGLLYNRLVSVGFLLCSNKNV